MTALAALKSARVGVIGAGVAGLQMARALRARGIECKVFDKAPAIGGLWRENYHSFGVQVPKQLYEFPDFPNTFCAWGEFPTGEKTQEYIVSYAEAFDLHSSIVLNTSVDKLTRHPDSGRGWTFHTTSDGQVEEYDFDYAVVASGMYSAPKNMPALPGREDFEAAGGTVIHSSEYLDPKVCGGKNVVVLGRGKSAIDIVVDSASEGKSLASTLLFRRAHWGTPRKIAGLIPFQYIFLSRLGQSLVSWLKGAWPHGAPGITHTMHAILAAPMRPIFMIVEAIFAFQLGHYGKHRPSDDVVRDFYGYAQVLERTFMDMVSSGQVGTEQGEVARLEAGSLVYTTPEGDERSLPCDVCVCATGFSKSYAYLPPADAAALGVESDGLYLYRHIFPPDVADLAFCGSEVATISNIMTHAIHAEYIASVVGGELVLPPADEQRAEIETTKVWKRQWMPPTTSRASLVLLHQTHYHDSLMMDLGRNADRKGNLLATLFMPYYPSDYDGVITKPAPTPVA
mmetsp:Transcript_28913/g.47988  ORF Transcript_28913/g.47988 Transcript_28913/m.47988 type:complete len:511 (-) Transcript_28913:748-2280(-)